MKERFITLVDKYIFMKMERSFWILFFLVVVFLPNTSTAQDKDDVVYAIKYLVYLDGNVPSMNRNTVDSTFKRIRVNKIDVSESIYCDVFKVSIDSCNCNYYIAYQKEFPQKLYKLKGFRQSEFLHFFNGPLMDNCPLKKYKLNGNVTAKQMYNVRRKCILENIRIDELDIKELYNYYYYNSSKIRDYSKDIYSCYEKTVSISY